MSDFNIDNICKNPTCLQYLSEQLRGRARDTSTLEYACEVLDMIGEHPDTPEFIQYIIENATQHIIEGLEQ